MIKLKKIGVLSMGYGAAIVMAIMTLIQALMIKVQTIIPYYSNSINPDLLVAYQGKAFLLLLVVSPLAGLIGGFVAGLVLALIYNYIVVPICGGIKIELDEPKKK